MQCPHCNQQHPDNSTFCPNTGKKIERPAAARPAPKPRGRMRLFSWIVIVVCGLCGIVVIGFLALLVLWKTPALSALRLGGAVATATVNGGVTGNGGTSSGSGSVQGSWMNSGPEGGNVTALAVDPADAKIVYAGTSAAGIFKSTDGGGTWAPANTGLADGSSLYVLSLAVDPQQPATLYAGTYGGLYKSTDSGETWLRLTLDSSYATYYIPFLAISPQAHTTVYAAEMSGKFLKSTDGGVTWSTSEIGGSSDYISVMAVDPAGVIYAYTSNTLEQSRDGGTTWTSIPLSDDYASVYSLAFDPAHPGTILAGTDDGVIKSVDGGQSWKATNLDKADVESLAVDPGQASTVYAAAITGGHVDYGASIPKKGLFVSTDGGGTWKKVNTGDLPGEQINSMLITPEGFLAGTRQGFFKGTSSADGWVASNSGLRAIPFTSLAAAGSNPTVLYAGTGGFGVYQSSDGGQNWDATGSGLPGGYVPVVAVEPQTPTTVYAVVESEPRQTVNNNGFDGLYKSVDAGKTWKTIDSGSTQGFNSDNLLIDPQTPTTMYTLSTFEGFHKSLDGGVTWTEANTGLDNPISIQAFVMDRVNPQVLYAMSFEHFYTTTDGAKTWTEVATDLQIFAIKFMWADPLRAGTLYGSSFTDGQLKSTDGGAHWTSASSGQMDEGFTLLAVDPRQPANLFGMGVNNTFANLWIGSPLMLGVSRDGGESWSKVDTGLGGLHVYAMLLDPADPSIIYLGTTQGFFKGQYTPGP